MALRLAFPQKMAQYEARIPRTTMSPLYEPCNVAEAMSERRRM